MRLFVAVDLDAAVRQAVGALIADLKAAVQRDAPWAARALRWVDADNLHLTLHFLGDVDDARVGPLCERLSQDAVTAAFTLELGGVGCFPASGAPRIVWLGVSNGTAGMTALHDEIAARLRAQGFETEARAFQPHLTLARVKDVVRPGLRDILRREAGGAIGESHVSAATLYRSVLGPRGATYTALASMALRAT